MIRMAQRIKRSEKAKLDRERRKAQAFAEGKEVSYLTCPLCGRSRPLRMWKKDTRFQVKPGYAIVTTRKGGGRRIGFFRLKEKDVKLPDLKEAYPLVYANLLENVRELSSLLEDLEK